MKLNSFTLIQIFLVLAQVFVSPSSSGAQSEAYWSSSIALARTDVGSSQQEYDWSLPTSWEGIVPLVTTRNEMERLLGSSTDVDGPKVTYKGSSARIDVWYSTGPCNPVVGRWNVPAGVVVAVDVYLKRPLLLDRINFDRSKYVRDQWSHPANWATYFRDEEGIRITTADFGDKAEIVQSISFLPKAKDRSLRCQEKGAQS
jgi:hypothetical protein